MALEQELKTYRAKLPEWKDREGKFVLIHGEEVIDFFSTYEDAIKAGYQKYKLEPFLVKRVRATEPVFFISRNIIPSQDRLTVPHFTLPVSPQGPVVDAAVMVGDARQQALQDDGQLVPPPQPIRAN